jgi:predicted NAD/FAD-binding protein
MRIAVIGAGVSGLGAAWALRDRHDVTLFEAQARLGGHANTLTIDYDGARIDVDTGFIVFNAENYPNLVGLLAHFGIETIGTDMSFAVSDPSGYEWSSNGFSGIFAWKRNLTSPRFLCMLGDIVRFSTAARADLERAERIEGATIADYVAELKLSRGFLQHYLVPMGAAIWSTCEKEMLRYPALSFLRFFDNHRLLHARRPQWRTIRGGSRVYVEALARDLGPRVRRAAPVLEVRRSAEGVRVLTAAGGDTFDHVILACHSDEALALLADPSPAERNLLSAVRYAPNTAYLHRDERLMPARRAAWASWNYMRPVGEGSDEGAVCVSYWMNTLQELDAGRPLFVTLNPRSPPREALTFAQIPYSHPQFDAAALSAQRAFAEIQGRNGLSFAGAWLGYGFHEDGLASGLAAARRLGGRAPWDEAAAPVAAADAPAARAAA